MAFKVLLCVFAFFGQSFAGPYRPSSSCSCQETPVYNCEGTAISEIESYQPRYKSISSTPIVSDNGGAFIVTSVGPISPIGIGVASDLSLAGELVLSGALPYLSAVSFEGQFDASGTAPVEYGCGDCVAITEQIGGQSGSYNPLKY